MSQQLSVREPGRVRLVLVPLPPHPNCSAPRVPTSPLAASAGSTPTADPSARLQTSGGLVPLGARRSPPARGRGTESGGRGQSAPPLPSLQFGAFWEQPQENRTKSKAPLWLRIWKPSACEGTKRRDFRAKNHHSMHLAHATTDPVLEIKHYIKSQSSSRQLGITGQRQRLQVRSLEGRGAAQGGGQGQKPKRQLLHHALTGENPSQTKGGGERSQPWKSLEA